MNEPIPCGYVSLVKTQELALPAAQEVHFDFARVIWVKDHMTLLNKSRYVVDIMRQRIFKYLLDADDYLTGFLRRLLGRYRTLEISCTTSNSMISEVPIDDDLTMQHTCIWYTRQI